MGRLMLGQPHIDQASAEPGGERLTWADRRPPHEPVWPKLAIMANLRCIKTSLM